MKKMIFGATGAAIIAAALATPALAAVTVEPGVYVFQAADGSTQTFTVTIDSNDLPAVTALSIGFIEPCKVTGTESPYTLQSGWGFGGDYEPKPDGKVTFTAEYNYYTFDVTIDFGSDGTATGGTIASYGVTLYPADPFVAHPKRALLCESPLQDMTFESFTPSTDATTTISTPRIEKFVVKSE